MKRISLITVVTLSGLFAWSALAQDAQPTRPARQARQGAGGAGGQGGAAIREQMQKMEEELKLTDEQKTKLQEARKEQAEKMRGIRDDTSLTQEQRIAKMKEMREANQAKMKTILTTEQFEKWTKMQSERPMRRGPGAAAGGAAAPSTGEKKSESK